MTRSKRGWIDLAPFAAALGVVAIGLAGCPAKAKPAPSAGFIPSEDLIHSPKYPFQKVWFKDGVVWGRFSEVHIAAVNTDYLMAMDWWKKVERGAWVEEDVKKLADYTRRTFEEAFREDENRRFRVVEVPGPGTLIGEIALVEVVPSKVTLNLIGYAPFVGSAAKLLRNTTSRSSVAMEARVRDGGTGEIVALFADREWEKMAPVNVKDLTWYGHAESIVWEWAHQFVKVANRKKGEAIKDSRPFTLKPL